MVRSSGRALLAVALVAAGLATAAFASPDAAALGSREHVAGAQNIVEIGLTDDGARYVAWIADADLVVIDPATGEITTTLSSAVERHTNVLVTPDSQSAIFF